MKEYWDFPNYIYTLYLSDDTNEQVLEFVEREDIEVVVMWYNRILAYPEIIEQLRSTGTLLFAHTINNLYLAQELLELGVYGIFTNLLTYTELPFAP